MDEIGETINDMYTTYKGNGFQYSHRTANAEELLLPATYFHNGKFWQDDLVSETQMEYFLKICQFSKKEETTQMPMHSVVSVACFIGSSRGNSQHKERCRRSRTSRQDRRRYRK